MTSLVRARSICPTPPTAVAALLARKPVRVATVAMANKAARVIWAIMARGEIYRAPRRRRGA